MSRVSRSMPVEEKRRLEKITVEQMIDLYCKKNHKEKYNGEMCPECAELRDYAWSRSDHCPFMETKTFCSNCTVHCYKPEMREKIRVVMRFSGPRITLYHPYLATLHVVLTLKEKNKIKKAKEQFIIERDFGGKKRETY